MKGRGEEGGGVWRGTMRTMMLGREGDGPGTQACLPPKPSSVLRVHRALYWEKSGVFESLDLAPASCCSGAHLYPS